VGKLQGQEGISNLVEAFLVAGSKSVIASLWSANDTSARALMKRRLVAKNEDKRALGESRQRSIIAIGRGRYRKQEIELSTYCFRICSQKQRVFNDSSSI
jgi:hypothetical protein